MLILLIVLGTWFLLGLLAFGFIVPYMNRVEILESDLKKRWRELFWQHLLGGPTTLILLLIVIKPWQEKFGWSLQPRLIPYKENK